MTNQAKHAAALVPTDVAPTICSAQYPVALVDVLGRSFEKWLQLKVSIRVREDCRCVAARVSSQFGSRLVGSSLFQIRFQICFRYVSDRMFLMSMQGMKGIELARFGLPRVRSVSIAG